MSAGQTSLANLTRSEWTKLRSVRSTFWTTLTLVVVTIGFSVLLCSVIAATWEQATQQNRDSFDATSVSLGGMLFGQLALVVLGVMVISTEYSTGGIRTTLTAVPQRVKLLAGKGIVLLAFSLVVGLVTSFASFFIGQLILGTKGINVDIGDPDVLRAVVGGGLYLAASAMFGFALGALMRSTAGGITMAVGALFVLPIIAALLPGSWGEQVGKYLTSNAGSQVMTVESNGTSLGPWAGFAVFCVWWIVILLVAGVLMRRRDA